MGPGALKNLARFAHNWNNGTMEYWDHWCSIWLKNNTVDGINKPWIEKTLIQTLKLCVFDHYSIVLSEAIYRSVL